MKKILDHQRLSGFLVLFFFFGILLLVYSPGLKEDFFILDDEDLLMAPQLKMKMGFQLIETLFTLGRHVDYYPLRDLTYWIDIHLLGADIFGVDASVYRVQNFLWMFLASACIFWIALKSHLSWTIAFLMGLIWLWHPVHSEMLMWASARKDVLAIVFILFSIYFYILHQDSKDRQSVIFCCFFALLSFMSKATFCLLPLVLLIRFRKELITICLLSLGLVFTWVQLFFYSTSTDMRFNYDFNYRWQASLVALGKAFLGWIWYGENTFDVENWGGWVSINKHYISVGIFVYLVGLVMFLISFLEAKKRNQFGLLQIFVGMLLVYIPVSGLFFSHRNFYSVRYFEATFLFFMSWWIFFLKSKSIKIHPRLGFVILTALFGFYSLQTIAEARVWAISYGPLEKSYHKTSENPALIQRLISGYQNQKRWGQLDEKKQTFVKELIKKIVLYCQNASAKEFRNGHLCQSYWLQNIKNSEDVSSVQNSLASLENSWREVYFSDPWPLYWFHFTEALKKNRPQEQRRYAEALIRRPILQINRPSVRLSYIIPLCIIDRQSARSLIKLWEFQGLLDQNLITEMSFFAKSQNPEIRSILQDCVSGQQ